MRRLDSAVRIMCPRVEQSRFNGSVVGRGSEDSSGKFCLFSFP